MQWIQREGGFLFIVSLTWTCIFPFVYPIMMIMHWYKMLKYILSLVQSTFKWSLQYFLHNSSSVIFYHLKLRQLQPHRIFDSCSHQTIFLCITVCLLFSHSVALIYTSLNIWLIPMMQPFTLLVSRIPISICYQVFQNSSWQVDWSLCFKNAQRGVPLNNENCILHCRGFRRSTVTC